MFGHLPKRTDEFSKWGFPTKFDVLSILKYFHDHRAVVADCITPDPDKRPDVTQVLAVATAMHSK